MNSLYEFSNDTKNNKTNSSSVPASDAAGDTVMYVEKEHNLPDNVTVGNTTHNVTQYLKPVVDEVLNISQNVTNSTPIWVNVTGPDTRNASETLTQKRDLSKADYLKLASDVQKYIRDNNNNNPSFLQSTVGTINFENLLYTFSQILNSYKISGVLPNFITLLPWNTVKNNDTYFIPMNSISDATDTVITYIETTHRLPDHVTMVNSAVDMPQFLYLLCVSLKNFNSNLTQSIVLRNFNGPSGSFSETMVNEKIISLNYCLDAANRVISSMDSARSAPSMLQIRYTNTGYDDVRYESLIYSFCRIINSAAHTNQLPIGYTFLRWSVVSNSGTFFVTMDQVSNSAEWVRQYVEINHRLPGSALMADRVEHTPMGAVSMSNYLYILVTALVNSNQGFYGSVVQKSCGSAHNPSEHIDFERPLSYASYWDMILNTKSFMKTNSRAPNYISFGGGLKMQYENLIYTFTQTLCHYSFKGTLPESVEMYRWTTITSASTVFYNVDQVIKAAEDYCNYVESYHNAPSTLSVNGASVVVKDFFKLAYATLNHLTGTTAGSLILVNVPRLQTNGVSENTKGGVFNQTSYLDYAKKVEIEASLGRAIVFDTSIKRIGIESSLYMVSQILSSYNQNHVLPDIVHVTPWSILHSADTTFYTPLELINSTRTVVDYIETNHQLPNTVTVGTASLDMKKFLYLAVSALLSVNNNLNTKIALKFGDYDSNIITETITGGIINSTTYLKMAGDIENYMASSGRAPGYATGTGLGDHMGFENLVYAYTRILNSYKGNNGTIPDLVTVNPWNTINNPNTKFFTINQVINSTKNVVEYVEANHKIPNTVNVNGNAVDMKQFLDLTVTTLLSLGNGLNSSIALETYRNNNNSDDNIIAGDLSSELYLKVAGDIKKYMGSTGTIPGYATGTGLGEHMGFENLVYTYSQILNSYNNTNNTLPLYVTVNPWNVIKNNDTIFVSTDEVKRSAETTKTYIETNHTLPDSVDVVNAVGVVNSVSRSSFLKLLSKAVISIENSLKASVILENVNNPVNITENITAGNVVNGEFVDLAKSVIEYIDTHEDAAPGTLPDTSLGNFMSYNSLIYMFTRILASYNSTNLTPEDIDVVPWLTVSNPSKTYNFRLQKAYESIQGAVDDTCVIDEDIIYLGNSNYLENVIVGKSITIKPLTGVNCTITALNSDNPVFTLTGNSTTITGFNITGSTNNTGIYINNGNENQISLNTIKGNQYGILISNSSMSEIVGNEILNSILQGVKILNNSINNTVSDNKIKFNTAEGIYIENCDDNRVMGNVISNNKGGIKLNNTSTKVNYNVIVGNSRYGLYNTGNGTTNATNNWWGTNTPLVSSDPLVSYCDIFLADGTALSDPYLVLNLNIATDRSDREGTCYNYDVVADLTHNNKGEDTSSDGNIPDNIPLNFFATLGTITASGFTRSGKAVVRLNGTNPGLDTISVTLDNQSVNKAVNITTVDNLGIYNTRNGKYYKTVQEAIDDTSTINGDTITIKEGTYTENIRINKKITLKPETGNIITIKAKEDDKSVIVIGHDGSGTTITGLNIIGSDASYGVALSYTYNCIIQNNNVTNNNRNIYLYLSGNNTITGNIVKSCTTGINLYKSIDNNIFNNIITHSETGIYLTTSNYNTISNNQIIDNYYGVYVIDSNNNKIISNNVTDNWAGIYLIVTNNHFLNNNNVKSNGAGLVEHNSIGNTVTGNVFSANWLADTSTVDESEIVIATTNYTCGPAALATILKKFGVYTTEAELSKLAGTDYTGTSLLGLKNAAIAKGQNTFGYTISSIEQLKPDYIVVLKINGYNHFEVIQSINSTSLTLFDPNLGIIQMEIAKFNELYTGYTFVLNNPITSATELTDQQLKDIKGLWHSIWKSYLSYEWRSYTITIDKKIPYPVIKWSYHHGWNIWTPWGPREVGGFWYPSGYEIRHYHLKYKKTISYVVPVWKRKIERVPDRWDTDHYRYVSWCISIGSAVSLCGNIGKGITVARAGGASVIKAITKGILPNSWEQWSGNIVGIAGIIFDTWSPYNPDPNPSGLGEPVFEPDEEMKKFLNE